MEKQNRKQKVTSGRWTRAEHEKFMEALEKYGRDWIKVQKKVKTRTLLQIRSHAQKVFLNMSQDDIKAFIGIDEDSSFHLDQFLYEDIDDKNSQLKLNCSLSGRKNNSRSQVKKEEDSSFEQSNTQIASKYGSEVSDGNLKVVTPKVIVTEVSNKSETDESGEKDKNYDSIFLQMFKQNQGYFMKGGDFLNLMSKQSQTFPPLCYPMLSRFSFF